MPLPPSPRRHVSQLARRVLVVEDDALVRNALVRLLTLRGFETLSASTLAGGLEQLAFRPDVVLTDLHLPDGNGVDLLHRVRCRDGATAVAVITGADDATVASVRPLRPDAVFRKPFDAGELMRWLDDPRPRGDGETRGSRPT